MRCRSHNHAISTPSRAICGTDCPLESIRLMSAIDGGTVAHATKTRSIALDSAKDAHMLMKTPTSPSTVNAIAGFADRAVSTSLKPDARKLYKRNILDSLGCA